MARNDTFDVKDNRFDDDDDDDRRGRGRRTEGWSTTTKVIIGILAVGGISMLLCCGGLFWQARKLVKNMENAFTEEPAKIAEIQKSITEMDIPADLAPKGAVNMDALGLMQMKMAMYGEGTEGSLMLMEMNFAGLSEEDMEKQFKQQAGAHGGPNQDVNIESSETRKFTINGKECRFVFAKGTTDKPFTGFEEMSGDMAEDAIADAPVEGTPPVETPPAATETETPPPDGVVETPPVEGGGESVAEPGAGGQDDNVHRVRQISDMFPSKGGFAFLFMIIPEEKWDEDAVVKMIESIHK